MKLSHRIAAAAIGLACLSASSWASVLFTLDNGNSYNVEYVGGTGSNKAIMEIVFPNSNGTVLFGYQWDGSLKGADLVQGVVATTTDSVTNTAVTQPLGMSGSVDKTWGLWVSGLSYKGLNVVEDFSKNNWWSFFTSPDGANWTYAQVGISSWVMPDNGFLGFTYGLDSQGNSIVPAAAAPVPEPASLGLLIIGLLMKYRRR